MLFLEDGPVPGEFLHALKAALGQVKVSEEGVPGGDRVGILQLREDGQQGLAIFAVRTLRLHEMGEERGRHLDVTARV